MPALRRPSGDKGGGQAGWQLFPAHTCMPGGLEIYLRGRCTAAAGKPPRRQAQGRTLGLPWPTQVGGAAAFNGWRNGIAGTHLQLGDLQLARRLACLKPHPGALHAPWGPAQNSYRRLHSAVVCPLLSWRPRLILVSTLSDLGAQHAERAALGFLKTHGSLNCRLIALVIMMLESNDSPGGPGGTMRGGSADSVGAPGEGDGAELCASLTGGCAAAAAAAAGDQAAGASDV